MKRKYIITLTVSLIFLFAFTGCKKSTPVADVNTATENAEEVSETPTEEPVDTEVTQDEEEVPVNPEELVVDSYANEGSYLIKYEPGEEGYDFEFSYNIPMITDGSPVAEKVNKEISDKYAFTKDFVEPIMKGEAEEVYEADFRDIHYDTYFNNNIVSIVITAEGTYSDWVEFTVYNYDFEKKALVSDEELLKSVNMTEEDFYKKAKLGMGQKAIFYIKELTNNADSPYDENGEINQYARILPYMINDYVKTVNSVDLNKDTQIFIDDKGNINVISLVHVQAGGGQYYNIVSLGEVEDTDANEVIQSYVDKLYYDGFERSCFDLYDVEGYGTNIKRVDDNGNTYYSSLYLGFDDKDSTVFLYQENSDDIGVSLAYSGTIKYVGVDEKGIIYEYKLTHLDGKEIKGEPLSGKFYLRSFFDYNEVSGEYITGAVYTHIDGYDLVDSNGEGVELLKVFG